MTDNDLMPFGKYYGFKLIDVPDEYLIWIYKNVEKLRPDLKRYIKTHIDEKKLNGTTEDGIRKG